nr:sugar-transfer associated ATP-grasp domain-containing protein [Parahaliea mediterranea]
MYYEHALWRRELSLAQKRRHLKNAEFVHRVHTLNPPVYRKLSDNKLAEKALLQSLGVPTAPLLGHLHPHQGSDTRCRPLTNPRQLEALLGELGESRVCFKLPEGLGGEGFIAAEIRLQAGDVQLRRLPAGPEFQRVAEFYSQHLEPRVAAGLLIERYVEQHPQMARFNPSSLNTLRIWVLRQEAEVRVLGMVLRIGRQGEVVDNTHNGGILAQVDLASGRLARAKTGDLFPATFSRHPDSGVQIEGQEVPLFDACLALAREALRVFPRAHFAGLDMAITESGPLIVELNLEPSAISARNFGAPLGDLLTW